MITSTDSTSRSPHRGGGGMKRNGEWPTVEISARVVRQAEAAAKKDGLTLEAFVERALRRKLEAMSATKVRQALERRNPGQTKGAGYRTGHALASASK